MKINPNKISASFRQTFVSASILSIAILLSPFIAFCQQEIPKSIEAPDQKNQIYLYGAPKQGELPEQWEVIEEGRIIRNVVSPSLIPFLPDPNKATGAAVIVVPGGAFRLLSIDLTGYEIAEWLADQGIAAFILKYRLEETPRPPAEYVDHMQKLMSGFMDEINSGNFQPATPQFALEDSQAAVRLIRARAKEWNIDPNRVGLLGFSAGALIGVSNACTTDPSGRADFIGSLYGQLVLKPVPSDAPPLFIAMASDDPLSGQGGFEVITAWQKAGRSVELHLYSQGGHGFGIPKKGTTSDLWTEQFLTWMAAENMLPKKK